MVPSDYAHSRSVPVRGAPRGPGGSGKLLKTRDLNCMQVWRGSGESRAREERGRSGRTLRAGCELGLFSGGRQRGSSSGFPEESQSLAPWRLRSEAAPRPLHQAAARLLCGGRSASLLLCLCGLLIWATQVSQQAGVSYGAWQRLSWGRGQQAVSGALLACPVDESGQPGG